MVKTKNFNLETDPKLACTCGHSKCDKRAVEQWALDRVQHMRNDYGRPMIITSGGRCQYHPNEINKDTVGDHQKCATVDIKCDDELDETKLKVLAGRYGATRVAGGAYCGFVHVCFTPDQRRDVPTWSYK